MGEIIIKSNSTPSTPTAGYGSLYEDSADNQLKFKNESGNVYSLSGGAGWIPASETWTYESADAPTYTFTTSASNVNLIYSPGMKFKMTHNGSTKYAICTAVGGSAVTAYMGTDYVLSGSPITNPYYSTQKSPYGFPLDPTKWTVEVTDTSARTQSSPNGSTFYNLGSVNITIPIGAWIVWYQVEALAVKSTSTLMILTTTLSTANNSESDSQFSAAAIANDTYLYVTNEKTKCLTLTSKTVYYLNTKGFGTLDSVGNGNDVIPLVIRARCAYL